MTRNCTCRTNAIAPYLGSALLGELILQAPDAILVGKALCCHSDLGQDAHLKAAHAEQQVGVVPTVHADKAVVPVESRQRPAQWRPPGLVTVLPHGNARLGLLK